MYDTSDFRNGLKIEIDGTPFEIIEFLHVKPGKGGAFVRTKLKNLQTGAVLNKTFRSGEKVGKPDLVDRHMQFLYSQGDELVFMDLETYEQFTIPFEKIEDKAKFLKENMEVDVLYYKNEPISVELPTFVELEVVETEPGFKGDTATGGTKPAVLETGAKINVPLFINVGDKLKIDTRTGQYVERVK
ncbi:elongation factor P [Thermotomaculum hydrothermale]|uniref:Elongation factor P n=1 Tax=Thermotomaculum hydrothermale TaxID=981385 RepID=A0A7R6SXJ5_9BACT|nr:elongation factor P [Thermotomaculum hydrothermale]BBB31859.1 elongation factor P [Thermotomaculum hydrothermale]